GGQLIAEGCLNQAIVREISDTSTHKNGTEEKSGNRTGEKANKGSGIVFYVALFGLLITPGLVCAQQTKPAQNGLPQAAPTEVLSLTLDQAVTIALKQNTTAQIAMITAAQSVQDKNIARAALLPDANLNVSDQVQRINVEAFLGKKIP